jgi:hypothetical protein
MKTPRVWPKLGPILKVLGAALALVGFGACRIAGREHLFLVPVGSVLVLIGGVLVIVGEFTSPSGDATATLDDRKPILFLRSFAEDDPKLWYRMYRQTFYYGGYFQTIYTPEEVMADIFGNFGRFIALGNPGEGLAPRGAARSYFEDDKWQSELVKIIQAASLVVVQIGNGDALLWEIEQVVKRGLPRSTLFYLPKRKSILFRTLRESRTAPIDFDRFRLRLDSVLPKGLPREVDPGAFIWFDGDWNPEVLQCVELSFRSYLPIAIRSRQYKIFIEIFMTLRPVLEEVFDTRVELSNVTGDGSANSF